MKNIPPILLILFKGGGWGEQRQPKMQPSAEIVRVERAKCRERDLSWPRATLCRDRACRVRETQARARAICPMRAQPSAEIARVELAKRRRDCDLFGARATLCGDRACRAREMQARVRFVRFRRNPLRRSRVSSARNAGESAICPVPAQPSAEIVRVERAKCRRECDLSGSGATLCRDRACREGERQARVRFVRFRRNPLRRSRASSVRNVGESAICPARAVQPSAEIACVKAAKGRRECDLSGMRATLTRRSCRRECDLFGARATLCGDRAFRVCGTQAVPCARNPLRRSRVSSARNAGESAFQRLAASLLEEVAYEPLCFGDRDAVEFWCEISVRDARFVTETRPLHFWMKSRTKRSF